MLKPLHLLLPLHLKYQNKRKINMENSMVKLRKWLLRWSNPTANKNAPCVLVMSCHTGGCMVCTLYLQSNLIVFQPLNFLNHQIKHLTSVIVLPFTLYLFLFSFLNFSSFYFKKYLNKPFYDNPFYKKYFIIKNK